MKPYFSFRPIFRACLLAGFLLLVNTTAQADGVYKFSEMKEAERRAQEQGLGVAWVCSTSQLLAKKETLKGNSDDISQMIFTSLRRGDDSCVVIFVDGKEDLINTPPLVYDAMVHRDELNFKTHQPFFYIPKIVFTNADASFVFGKVTYTQMYHDREGPLITMLFHVAREIHKGQYDAAPPATPPPTAAPEETTPAGSADGDSLAVSDEPGSQSQNQALKNAEIGLGNNLQSYIPAGIMIMAITLGSGLLIYQLVSWARPHTGPSSGTSYEPPAPRFPPIPNRKPAPPRQDDHDFRPR